MNLNGWPNFTKDEINDVEKILLSGKVNYWNGIHGKEFEKEFADFTDSKFALSHANGTLALTSAYFALNLKPNDEVITSPRTFIATSSSACLQKLKPIYADVDLESGNITAESIEPLINKKTKAISVVHLGGWPADLVKISQLAKEYDLYLIEDCAQAHGAAIKYNDKFKSVGSFGDVSAWSFCLDKIISTVGEGGMVTTNSEYIYDAIWSLRDHGKSRTKLKEKKNSFEYFWSHNYLGSNFRLTEIQSAVGRSQLKKLSEWNKKREENALKLAKALRNISCVRVPLPNREKIRHGWYKFYCYIEAKYLKSDWNRNRIIKTIQEKNYPASQGSCGEIYNEEALSKINLRPELPLKNAKLLGETSLMFVIHPSISNTQMDQYIELIVSVLKKAMR